MDTPIVISSDTLMVEGVTARDPDPEAVDDDVIAPDLWDAFVAGFMASHEGGNGEYPHAYDEESVREAKRAEFVEWVEANHAEER